MDDTTQSRTSDFSHDAATRKRRSSILKSQRPPRTPLCELEFNVCTPTDTTKSRRVSFSKRTGVAEFATNEATTTWKNFYEEHNKSLESSGNDSGMNNRKQPIAHLGKRIFDEQFEEIEAIDFMGTLKPRTNITTSINNTNFAHSECTETKLTAPQSNFELSAFTETQSKIFGDNLPICTTEISGHIDVNFSAMQPIGENDDLDDIQLDLQRHSNDICQGPFTGQNVSEYFEVDLNMTHVAITNNESYMSITDTINTPKVQDVTRSCSIDKKINICNNDWVTDKENIVLNPYMAPRESTNFAVTETPDEILVFDGKRLIVETENTKRENYRQTILPKPSERVPQRKTIVLNCNDDLPNFIEETQVSKNQSCFGSISEMQQSCILEDNPAHHHLDEMKNEQRTIIFGDELDTSVMQAFPNVIADVDKQRTIVYNDHVGNVSVTQALPSNIIDKEKRRTIVYENENANISITQAVPANIITANENNEKRKTIVFEDETCNISMTHAIPTNIIAENVATKQTIVLEDGAANVSFEQVFLNAKNDSKESKRTIVYEDITGNISVTQSITAGCSNEKVPESMGTGVFNSDIGNISFTQALPSNILLQKQNVTTYGNNDISITQALVGNSNSMKIEPIRRRTVVFEDDKGNLSITQAVTKNQVIQDFAHQQDLIKEPSDIVVAASRVLQGNNVNNRRPLKSEDVSKTHAPSMNQVLKQDKLINSPEEITENKRRTIVFQNDAADISITQAVPIRQVIDNIYAHNRKTTELRTTGEDLHNDNNSTNKRRTVVFENDDADISMTQAIPMSRLIDTVNDKIPNEEYNFKAVPSLNSKSITKVIDDIHNSNHNIEAINVALHIGESANKSKTVVFNNDDGNLSMTQVVPVNQIVDALQIENQTIEATNATLHQGLNNEKNQLLFDNAVLSMAQAVPTNKIINNNNQTILKDNHNFEETEITYKRRTVVFENDDADADLSITQAVPVNQLMDTIEKENQNTEDSNKALLHQDLTNKRRTVVFENEDADISMTEIISQNQVLYEQKDETKNITQNKSETVINDIIPYDIAMDNKTPHIIYDDDEGDISMTRAVSSSIILPDGQEKKRTIAVESVESLLKNKDLFIGIDILADSNSSVIAKKEEVYDISMSDLNNMQEKKRTIAVESVESLLKNKDLFIGIDILADSNSSVIAKKEEIYDISMSDLNNMEISVKEVHDGNETCITKAIIENFSPSKQDKSRIKIEKPTATLSKPIPARLVAFQQETIDKSDCIYLAKHDGTIPDAVGDVLVYQSLTSNKQNVVDVRNYERNSQITSVEGNVASEETKDSSQSLAKINSETKILEHEHLDDQSESNNVKLVADTSSKYIVVKTIDSKQDNSILDNLLDMSQKSFEGTEGMDLTSKISSVHEEPALANLNQADAKNSMDTMFYITKDSDEDRQTDKSESTSNKLEMGQLQDKSPLSIEYKDDNEPPVVCGLQAKLSILKNVIREGQLPQSIPTEDNKVDKDTDSKVSLDMSRRKSSKSFKMANDTNELLEMLSDFTDRRKSGNLPLEDLKEVEDTQKSHLSLGSKAEISKPEPSQFNRTLKRKSVVLNREDMMNDLAMISAVLQKSRLGFDDSDSINETNETNETPNISKEFRKSVTLSTDVVKTLQFEDDSVSEKDDSYTPLKKTAFAEISYMKEAKSKVIPDFMNNMSDGIKELMDDLVKPMSDVQPFTTPDKNIKNNPSTCSTQIQANLLTSSQIDLHTDLYSTTDSVCEMNKLSSVDIITDAVNRSMSRALKSPAKATPMFSQSGKSSDVDVTSDDTEDKSVKTTVQTKPVSSSRPLGSVLIFDQHNPLNNVLLVPTPAHAIDIHKYNPFKTEKVEPEPNQEDMEIQEDRITNQYHVELSTPVINSGTMDKADAQSITSNTSKPISIDQYTEPEINRVRDMEINTVIVMKGNQELLGASSSLTLVDDELIQDHSGGAHSKMSQRNTASSPIKVIYKVEEPSLTKMDSDCTSMDEIDTTSKPKKRVYSPIKREKHNHCTFSSLDVTPKPTRKMQKRSVSPDYEEPTKLPAEREKSPEPVMQEISLVQQRSPCRMRSKKPGTTITVQQLMTMVHVEANQGEDEICQERTDSSTTEPRSTTGSQVVLGLATSSEIMSSFASSNNLRCESSLGRSSVSGNLSKVEWLPFSTSHLLVDGMDSNDDLVGIIDAMPFMGSRDCQWESASGPEWRLLLLHSRLRLTVRFACEPRLRPDTPVLNIELETLHQDKKNTIAYLCVMFAGELMRHHMSRGCGTAREVGKLVRRVAGAARLAAQWARAMHDARARLAYSLSHDGCLALKVANTSFRTVWEVTMRLELVMENARAAPWPRACCVRVTRVLSASPGAVPPDVSRATAATPRDWGHAPRTIWKVFRYLKHKKRGDNLAPLQ